jgi:hypothetical protein
VIGLFLLASAQLEARELEHACQTGAKAADLLAILRSGRGSEYLEDFRQRLAPYAKEAVVREFAARLDHLAAV